MATRDRPIDRAAQRTAHELARIGDEVHIARLGCGLSQTSVARAVGGSQAQVSRLEHGHVRHIDVVMLSRVLAATGLRLSIRTLPDGSPVRDAGHVALLRRLRARLSPAWTWRLEVPVWAGTRPGDMGNERRRWDALARIDGVSVAFEAETRLYDVQAQLARALSKQASGSVDRLVLVVAETHHNRRVVREIGPLVGDDFPIQPRAMLTALGEGRDPGGNGIVQL